MAMVCELEGSTIGAQENKLLSLPDAKYEALNDKDWETIEQNCCDPVAPTATSWLWDKSHPRVC